jgi:RNA polymerase sigma-70 factor (ECF subfamily)
VAAAILDLQRRTNRTFTSFSLAPRTCSFVLHQPPMFGRAEVSILVTTRDGWLSRFHAGDRSVLEQCYQDHYDVVFRAAGGALSGADQETVVHEVFFRLLSDRAFREQFDGGSLGAWLAVVARNRAIDFARRRARDVSDAEGVAAADPRSIADAVEARLVIQKFRKEVLPPKWVRTFDLRFVEQLDQAEVAARLEVSRATVSYRESRIDALLREYLLHVEVV